jgi:chemotaxis protein CheX
VTTSVSMDQGSLLEAVESVWNDTLGLIVEVSPPTFGPRPAGNLTGWVQIHGEFDGAVTVQTTDAFMRQAAAVMFGSDPASVTREEILDALGELANMVGGTLKSLLPGPSRLTLPTVVEGDPSSSWPTGTIVSRIELTCIGDPIAVALSTR